VLKVFYVDEVKASRSWRGERSRWFFQPDEAPKSTLKYWSNNAGAASIEIIDSNDAVVRRLSGDAVHGMNSLEWDLLVDEELALAAETSAQEKAKESTAEADADDEEEKTFNLADTPYAESIRLGHSLYAVPGDYTIRVSVGENSDSTELKIKAPKDFEPRVKETYKLRGKKD
jgi:hypothetical protein